MHIHPLPSLELESHFGLINDKFWSISFSLFKSISLYFYETVFLFWLESHFGLVIVILHFFSLGFTPCKTEQLLWGMVLQDHRSQIKGKHSIGREFQSLIAWGKKLLTQTPLQHGDWKIMQSIRATSIPPPRRGKWNQLSQFWRTSTKGTLTEKT